MQSSAHFLISWNLRPEQHNALKSFDLLNHKCIILLNKCCLINLKIWGFSPLTAFLDSGINPRNPLFLPDLDRKLIPLSTLFMLPVFSSISHFCSPGRGRDLSPPSTQPRPAIQLSAPNIVWRVWYDQQQLARRTVRNSHTITGC